MNATDAIEASFSGSTTLDFCTLFASAVAGPVLFWIPASTELLAAAFGRRGYSPLLVGLIAATGQCVLFTMLFIFGNQLVSRWFWLRRKTEYAATRHTKLMKRGSLTATLSATAIGVPPTIVLFTLAPSFRLSLPPMIIIVFAGRVLRFSILCAVGRSSVGVTSMALWPDLSSLLRYTLHKT